MIDYSLPIFDRLQNCWEPPSEPQFEALERDLETALPDDFKQFARVFNAGYWHHGVWFRLLDCAPRWDELHIDANLGVIRDEWAWSEDIWGVIQSYEQRIPATFVPIMRSGVQLVGLDCGLDNHRRMLLWDHTFDENGECNIVPIADSFTSFIDALMPVDESEFYREKLPAFQAVERGDKSALMEFLSDGGRPDLRNRAGWTLAMCAARKSWPKVLAMLLDAGADPNALDAENRTPLLHSIDSDSFDSVKLLVAAGADVQFRDALGRNLAEIAKQEHSHRIARFFDPLMR